MRYPSGKTHLWAILAHPVAHVRAPEFMNPLIERAGRDAFLVPFHILPEDLEAAVRRAFPSVDVAAGAADGRGHDIVANATSLGLEPGDAMPLDPATLEPNAGLFDIIAVRDTELMAAASARGCRVIGG